MTEIGTSHPVTLPVMPATAAICPYLLAADGGWRASTPASEHRCTAVTPATVLAPEKQRRLCLVAEHQGCSTYAAASGVSIADGVPATGRRRHGRPVARTAPVVLDRGRVAVAMPAFRPDRIGGQGGLVALMGLAFAAILLARLTAGGPALSPTDLAGGTDPSATPGLTQDAGAEPGTTPGLTPDGAPTRTLVPTQGEPTPPPAATPGTDPTTGPAATPGRPSTYTIKSGDTLSGVAGEFGTTWQVLADLNGIDDPGRLRVGQVIDLP